MLIPVMLPPGRARLATSPVSTGSAAIPPHDDWDRAGRVLGSKVSRRAGGHDEIHLQGDQLGGQHGQLIVPILREAVLDEDVLALDVTALAQSLEQAIDHEPPAFARADSQKADPGDFRALPAEHLAAGQQADAGQDQTPLQELATAVALDRGSSRLDHAYRTPA